MSNFLPFLNLPAFFNRRKDKKEVVDQDRSKRPEVTHVFFTGSDSDDARRRP